jgi:hypothetical protein
MKVLDLYTADYENKKKAGKQVHKDKTLGNANYTWLYCAVPTKRRLISLKKGSVRYFSTVSTGETMTIQKDERSWTSINKHFEVLENEVEKLTGNAFAGCVSTNRTPKAIGIECEWKIRVWDNGHSRYQYKPSQAKVMLYASVQCLVRANRWLHY